MQANDYDKKTTRMAVHTDLATNLGGSTAETGWFDCKMDRREHRGAFTIEMDLVKESKKGKERLMNGDQLKKNKSSDSGEISPKYSKELVDMAPDFRPRVMYDEYSQNAK
ncbi:hypothetical protein JTB14_037759 [Gonioctena quinquepunctata]|nr:hypothetical protein JTB14_037759 [Gonioctena quinquepunctata]